MAARRDDINLWELAYRHRAVLGPFYVAGGSALAATASGAFMSTWPTAGSLLGLSLGAAAWIHNAITDPLRRAYGYTVTGASAAWIMAAHEYFRDYPDWLASLLLSGTVALGIPWWASRRRKSQVRMEATIQDWPRVASRIGLGDSRIVDVTMTPHGYEGTIIWPKGAHEVDSVMGSGSRIEGALGADTGSVEMDRNGKDPNSVRFAVITRDPHAAPQPWRPPTRVGSIADPLVLGPNKRGQEIKMRRFIPGRGVYNVLAAGQADSGKSSYINLQVADLVCCHDTFTVGFDFKKVELSPWKPALGFMTSEFNVAKAFLYGIAGPGGLLDERKDILDERGARTWDPKIDGPIISIVIDECRELLGKGDPKVIDYFTTIANIGRALGVRFDLCTQYPTVDAIGSTQIRQQIQRCLCFRMKDSEGQNYVIPNQKFRADKIDSERPGTCYFQDGNVFYDKPLRIRYLDDLLVKAVAAARAGETSELDSRSEAALIRLFPGFAERDRYFKEGDPRAIQRDSSETAAAPSGTATGVSGTATVTDSAPNGTPAGPAGPVSARQGESSETESRASGTATGSGAGPMNITTETDEPDLADVIRAHRDRQSPEERAERDREREQALAEQPGKRLSPAEAKAALIAELMADEGGGVQAKRLYEVADRSSSWLYPELHALEAEGLVERTVEHGNWRLTSKGRAKFGNSVASR